MQNTAINSRIAEIEQSILQMRKKHKQERKSLLQKQQKRRNEETKIRQRRFNKRLRGFIDWLTGKYKNIKQRNKQETWLTKQRDAQEKDALIFKQQELRRKLQERINRLENLYKRREQKLSDDMSQYHEVANIKQEFVKFERDLSQQNSRKPQGLER